MTNAMSRITSTLVHFSVAIKFRFGTTSLLELS
jgi:hypothetical protein